MGEKSTKHLKELIEAFDTGMLITRHGEDLHARPMGVADVEGASTLWFVTGEMSPKSEEIRDDARVSVTFQGPMKFIALSGRASLVSDRKKIEELWKPSWKAWFPEGKDDPSITLIRVTVSDGEFWDNTGTKGIRYAFEMVKAVVTGTTPETAPGQHGRVQGGAGAPASKPH